MAGTRNGFLSLVPLFERLSNIILKMQSQVLVRRSRQLLER